MPNSNTRTALVMAGGTGGHVFPALATARVLQDQGWTIEWLGTTQGIEATLVPDAGIRLHPISISGLRGKGLASLLLAPFKLVAAVMQSIGVIRELKPQVILGMGGFASGPGGLAAWLLRKPLVIHEQNAIAGMTNRYLARLARRVLEAFPNTFPEGQAVHYVGNPVRAKIANMPHPEQRLSERSGPVRLLVLGGSLGAAALNEAVPMALQQLANPAAVTVKHQAGKRNFEATQTAYQNAGVAGDVMPFIDDMAAAYAWADLVVCRAGALTIAELACAGLASFLVPFPHAVDDHQTANARFLEKEGAAVICQQTELTPQRLVEWLTEAITDRSSIIQRASKARALACVDAAQKVAEHCTEVCRV